MGMGFDCHVYQQSISSKKPSDCMSKQAKYGNEVYVLHRRMVKP